MRVTCNAGLPAGTGPHVLDYASKPLVTPHLGFKLWRPREEVQNCRDSQMHKINFSCIPLDCKTASVTPVKVQIPLDQHCGGQCMWGQSSV